MTESVLPQTRLPETRSACPVDHTALLLRSGYDFADRIGSRPEVTAVPIRLLGRRAVVVGGPGGVELFYDGDRVRRTGATPQPIRGTLFGRGAVHGLDDEPHRHRKSLFVQAVEPDRVDALAGLVSRSWAEALTAGGRVTVYDTAVEVFGVAVQRWAGLPFAEARLRAHARDMAIVVDGFGSIGPRGARAYAARRRSDRWARSAVRAARAGRFPVPDGSALATVLDHRDGQERPLPERTAAVELLNIMRPTVAVAWYAAAAVVQLDRHPDWRTRIADEARAAGPADASRALPGPVVTAFAHEIRRTTPFVPVLAARTRRRMQVGPVTVPAGRRIILDVWGTHISRDGWADPERFDPARFLSFPTRSQSGWFVPQGGDAMLTGHRCPGEGITGALISRTAIELATRSWGLPPQDLTVDHRRMPTRPRDGVILQVTA
ncbi:cytochrome P450 [Nakamurella leprariae]|uniref:Cytochrome P450 n=1 Tax=Nakamurella leprariae TaxID=2803911 RepID=A0A939BXZ1_9ACTN|nr:cytochrome P450 [Nakamurella leprariae]MBM9466076.1 cytochrome P450 [Nakamurella leprariae]